MPERAWDGRHNIQVNSADIGHHRGNKSALSSWARFVALYATAQAAAVSSDRPGDAFGRSAIIAETRAHSAAGRALSRFMQLLRQPPSAVIGPGMHSADRPSSRKQERIRLGYSIYTPRPLLPYSHSITFSAARQLIFQPFIFVISPHPSI